MLEHFSPDAVITKHVLPLLRRKTAAGWAALSLAVLLCDLKWEGLKLFREWTDLCQILAVLALASSWRLRCTCTEH